MADLPFHVELTVGELTSAQIKSFVIDSGVGRPAEATVEVELAGDFHPDEILGQPARFALGRTEPEQTLQGMVMGVTLVATPDDGVERASTYRLQITSRLAPLVYSVDCRIFQDQDVREIVTQVLTDHGVGDDAQSWQLVGSYPKRTYCVQYNESALTFITRLCEEEGIVFHCEPGDDGEKVVFTDDTTSAEPMPGGEELVLRHGSGMDGAYDVVTRIRDVARRASGKVVLRDYNFETPKLDMTVEAEADVDAELERYDYPGHYTVPDEGKRLAQVRLESLQASRRVLELDVDCPRVIPGRHLVVGDADDLDGRYFITDVRHAIEDGRMRSRVRVVPLDVPYRLPQRTPRPVLDGPQTAEVVAPEGSEPQTVHTDEWGRCKVRFHWDRYHPRDDSASCWIRVAQLQTSGSMILPRVGWEVLVEFEGGNPDRPVVTGRLFNGRNMPPYALPEGKTRTAIGTHSSPAGEGTNEIRFEDEAGSEEMMISSQKNTTLATANDKSTSVGANGSKNVTVNATLDVGGNQTIKVTNGYKNTVTGAQSVTVGGNRTIEVDAVYGLTSAGASGNSIGGNQMAMVGNPVAALISLAEAAAKAKAKEMAEQAMAELDAAVSAKVDQVMGPINQVQAQAEAVGQGMQAVSDGNLGAAAGAFGAAAGLPTPAGLGGQMMSPAGGPAGAQGLDAMAQGAMSKSGGRDQGAAGGGDTLGKAEGSGGQGGGGSSDANVAGPEGAVGGNAAANSASGPGHSIHMCSASHSETIGGLKAVLAASGINTTVTGARTQNIGAARVELVAGTRAETCLAGKTEKELGLIVGSGGPESETVGGARTTMVGGAIIQKLGGGYDIAAGGKAMFVGAFHKVEAESAIVLTCGASEVVIDGSGVAITSPAVTITASTVTLTKTTSEV